MNLAVLTILLMCCAAAVNAQTLKPNTFAMTKSIVGVPEFFPTTLKNTSNETQWLQGNGCTGEAAVDIKFYDAADSTEYRNKALLPGASINLLIRLTTMSEGLVQSGCYVNFKDTSGKSSRAANLAVGGQPSSAGNVVIVQPSKDFGNVSEGTTASANIVLTNTGPVEAHYRAISKPSLPFGIVEDKIWIVHAGDSVVVAVTFHPANAGIYLDTIEFGQAYIGSPSSIPITLRGTSGASTPTLVALAPTVNVTDVQTGEESIVNVAFVATSTGAQVKSVALRIALAFEIASIAALPVSLAAGDTLVVGIRFRPNSPGTFSDALTLTMALGPNVYVDLQGTAVVSGVTELTSDCYVHPNPAVGTVHWCSESQDAWLVINAVGSVVTTVNSDEQGKCAWTATGSGTYALRNVRTGEVLRVLVFK